MHSFCVNKFLKEKVSRVCVHLFCRESSKINKKKMMHSGVNNGIAGSPFFSAGPCRIVNLSPQPLYATGPCRIVNFSTQPFRRAIHSNRPFFYLNHLFYPACTKCRISSGHVLRKNPLHNFFAKIKMSIWMITNFANCLIDSDFPGQDTAKFARGSKNG